MSKKSKQVAIPWLTTLLTRGRNREDGSRMKLYFMSKYRRHPSLGGWFTAGQNREPSRRIGSRHTRMKLYFKYKYSRKLSLGGWFAAGQNKPTTTIATLFVRESLFIKQKGLSRRIRGLHNHMKPYLRSLEKCKDVY